MGERFDLTFVAANGDIWFAANPWLSPGATDAALAEAVRVKGEGIVRYDGDSWTQYTMNDGLLHDRIYGFGQSPDGKIWVGTRMGLSWFDGTKWDSYGVGIPGEKPFRFRLAGKNLWCGYAPNELTGVSRYDGSAWHTYTTDDGLVNNLITHILPASDGTVWVATEGGINRFSPVAETWASYTEEDGIAAGGIEHLWETQDGIGYTARSGVVGMLRPDTDAPRSTFNISPTDVGSSGNVMLTWSARDRWDITLPDDVRYRYRLDEGDWSETTSRTDVTLTSLSPGSHRIELRAIDDELNVEATPAVHAFIVEAPWWRNPVVAGPGLLLILGILFQSARVVQGKRKLQESVDALADANNELFQVNVDLQREQVLERLRGQAQGMQSSEEIGPVVEAVFGELKALHPPLLTSGINIRRPDSLEIWRVGPDGKVAEPSIRKREIGRRDVQRTGKPYLHRVLEGDEARANIQRHIQAGNPFWVSIPEEKWPTRKEDYTVLFPGGEVVVVSEESIDEETLKMVGRFGEVFAFAHARWEELKQKEAQNRRLAWTRPFSDSVPRCSRWTRRATLNAFCRCWPRA